MGSISTSELELENKSISLPETQTSTSSTLTPDLPLPNDYSISRTRKILIVTCLGLSQFFDICNAFAIFIALPSISDDLGFTFSSRQWVVSAYSLTFSAFMLLSGKLADILRPKTIFVTGFLIVGLLSIPIGSSVSPTMMIVLRALQGIGAAMTIPAGTAMIPIIFTDPKERAQVFTTYMVVASGGSPVGFIIGGFLTVKLSWRWVFYILGILCTPMSILSWIVLPSGYTECHVTRGKELNLLKDLRSLDWAGIFLVIAGQVLFVYAMSEGNISGWSKIKVIVPLIFSVTSFASFLVLERYIKNPSLPHQTWSNRNFTILFIYGLSLYWWIFPTQLQLAQIFIDLWSLSPISAAIHSLPLGIAALPTGILAGLTVRHIPSKVYLTLAQLFMATGSILLALGDSLSKYWVYYVPAMILGSWGLRIGFLGCMTVVMESARKGDEGVVSAAMNTGYQMGVTLGLAVVSAITLGVNDGKDYTGYAASFWSMAGLSGVMIILVIIFVRN